MYVPTAEAPLPVMSVMPATVSCIAFDAPQGLPRPGEQVRQADVFANTPTRRLPNNRDQLKEWKAYRGLIEAGISIFWWAHTGRFATVAGLTSESGDGPIVVETYPRYVIKRLWPDLSIPSKKNDALQYVDAVYSRIQKLGLVCRSVVRPSVDQVDAMICALAAREFVESTKMPAGSVGEPPVADSDAGLLREGFIISP